MRKCYFKKYPKIVLIYNLEKAASVLKLPFKKVYKWGYDRKHLSRTLGKPDINGEKDYNKMVGELLMSKVEDVRLEKRVYRKKQSKDVALSTNNPKSESEHVIVEDDRLEQKDESPETLYESNADILNNTMQLSNIVTADVDQGLFAFKMPNSPSFESFFKIRNVDDFFQGKQAVDKFTLPQDTQFDNIWSTNTTEYDV
jgi:hypothetical protein